MNFMIIKVQFLDKLLRIIEPVVDFLWIDVMKPIFCC